MSQPRAAVVALAIIFSAFFLSAPAGAAGKGKTQSVTITATAGTATMSQCTKGYANQCTSFGDCSCIVVSNPTVSGSLVGKGSPDGTLDITSDIGAAVTVGDSECLPLFADITLTNGSLNIDTAVLLLSCPAKASGVQTLDGSFMIESASNDETGGGNASGTFNPNTGALKLKLVGAISSGM